jgi:hypothetical protein
MEQTVSTGLLLHSAINIAIDEYLIKCVIWRSNLMFCEQKTSFSPQFDQQLYTFPDVAGSQD